MTEKDFLLSAWNQLAELQDSDIDEIQREVAILRESDGFLNRSPLDYMAFGFCFGMRAGLSIATQIEDEAHERG